MSDDSDETEGRRLYRAQADRITREQIAMSRRKVTYSLSRPQCGSENAPK